MTLRFSLLTIALLDAGSPRPEHPYLHVNRVPIAVALDTDDVDGIG